MATIDQAFARLRKSAFRARFHLTDRDRQYIAEKGMDTIRRHAADFVRTRLAPAEIPNDGKQTPMRGQPVFIAQHACACCCRGCLSKWYHIPPGRELRPYRIIGQERFASKFCFQMRRISTKRRRRYCVVLPQEFRPAFPCIEAPYIGSQ